MAMLSLEFRLYSEWDSDCRVNLGPSRFTGRTEFPHIHARDFAGFAEAIAKYPLSEIIEGRWGNGVLVLRARQINDYGRIEMVASLTDFYTRDEVTTRLLTDYASLQSFSEMLLDCAGDGSGTAELRYEPRSVYG